MTSVTIVRSPEVCQSRLPTTAKNKHIETVEKMGRKELLKERDSTTSKETKIPVVLTYSQSLLYISKVFHKHWNILHINKAFKEIFQNEAVTAFRCNKNLKELISSNKIEHKKITV